MESAAVSFAPRVLSISQGRAERGKDVFLRGGADCFSAGMARGGVGMCEHPCCIACLTVELVCFSNYFQTFVLLTINGIKCVPHSEG